MHMLGYLSSPEAVYPSCYDRYLLGITATVKLLHLLSEQREAEMQHIETQNLFLWLLLKHVNDFIKGHWRYSFCVLSGHSGF